MPDDAEAERLLDRLGVEAIDRAATLAARPDPEAHPALWWVLDCAYYDLLATMGMPVGAGLAALRGRHAVEWKNLHGQALAARPV